MNRTVIETPASPLRTIAASLRMRGSYHLALTGVRTDGLVSGWERGAIGPYSTHPTPGANRSYTLCNEVADVAVVGARGDELLRRDAAVVRGAGPARDRRGGRAPVCLRRRRAAVLVPRPRDAGRGALRAARAGDARRRRRSQLRRELAPRARGRRGAESRLPGRDLRP